MVKESARKPSCELEGKLFKSVFDKTPNYIKELDLIDLSNPNAFTFTLKREHLYNQVRPVHSNKYYQFYRYGCKKYFSL